MTDNLRDPRAAAAYLMVSLEDADIDYLKQALGNVARAYGIGSSPLPRAQVVKKLWAYIKKHGLTHEILEAGKKEVDEMARVTHRLVRQSRALSHSSPSRVTKKKA